jgi:hypothetical protein
MPTTAIIVHEYTIIRMMRNACSLVRFGKMFFLNQASKNQKSGTNGNSTYSCYFTKVGEQIKIFHSLRLVQTKIAKCLLWGIRMNMLILQSFVKMTGFRGRVARQGSAKARTAVRIRSEPQNDKSLLHGNGDFYAHAHHACMNRAGRIKIRFLAQARRD